MVEMIHGKGHFKGVPWQTRVDLRDSVFDVIDAHRPKLIVVAVDKAAHVAKYKDPDPPEAISYQLLIERFDRFLSREGPDIGIVVSDEQKGAEDPIRVAHSHYRRYKHKLAANRPRDRDSLFRPFTLVPHAADRRRRGVLDQPAAEGWCRWDDQAGGSVAPRAASGRVPELHGQGTQTLPVEIVGGRGVARQGGPRPVAISNVTQPSRT